MRTRGISLGARTMPRGQQSTATGRRGVAAWLLLVGLVCSLAWQSADRATAPTGTLAVFEDVVESRGQGSAANGGQMTSADTGTASTTCVGQQSVPIGTEMSPEELERLKQQAEAGLQGTAGAAGQGTSADPAGCTGQQSVPIGTEIGPEELERLKQQAEAAPPGEHSGLQADR